MSDVVVDSAELPDTAGKQAAERWRELAIQELREAGDRLGWHVEPIIESVTEVYQDSSGNWRFDVRHSKVGFVEFGTEPHIIRPKDAEALQFLSDSGEDVFSTVVNHPGTPAVSFMRKARQRTAHDSAEE